MKELYKKNKILFIASFCVVIGIIAFFAVHGVVYSIISDKNTQSMNEQLAGKTFVFYRDDQIWVANMNDDGTYIQKRYQKSDDGVVSLVATDGEKKLDYSYTFWGDLFLPGSELDSAGNIVKFGADGYTLATQEELSMIQLAEERELTKCTLSDFMMSMDEYRAAYKASGMPVSDELIDFVDESCILYKDDFTDTFVMAVNDMPDRNTFRVISCFSNGKILGYDYVMRPILLYLKDIPGALTDVQEITDRWDSVENTGALGNEIVAEFAHNGITYYRSENSSRIYVEIKVDKFHEVYLADYPEFMTESNTQPSDDDIDTDNDAPEPSQSIQDTEDNNSNNDSTTNNTNNSNNSNINSDSGKNNSASNSNSNVNSNPCATGHDWVAITKTVHHDAVGHYETVQDAKKVIKYQCAVCYNSFNSLDEYYSHFDQKHGYDNNLVAAFREQYEKVEDWEYYDTQKWVVDQEAYDETVTTGYKCSVCGTTK